MNSYLQGLKDGEGLYLYHLGLGFTPDLLWAIGIVKTLRKFNTVEKPDYWKGYLDGIKHHIKLQEMGIAVSVEEFDEEKVA